MVLATTRADFRREDGKAWRGFLKIESVSPRVIPRACGESSTPRRLGSAAPSLEYWIVRRSLSSGRPKAGPGGGR
jgi:hypothetical protein